MTQDQLLLFAVVGTTAALFLWGRWRHDVVAMASLLACVLLGLVPAADAFHGFGHPAVITVACVLVLSRGLQASGAVDLLARRALPAKGGPTLSLAALAGLGGLLSGFMNNVGAMALLMPIAIQLAHRLAIPPGRVLMPLAFATILGGMTTLIGTPPNLIVAGFRATTDAGPFAMFDFTPVGLAVAVAGIAFVTLIGWRLVPARRTEGAEGFETGAYLTEARVPAKSKADGMTLREIEAALADADAQVIGLVRNDVRLVAPRPGLVVVAGDILTIEADVEALADALSRLGLKLAAAKPAAGEAAQGAAADDEEEADAAGDEAAKAAPGEDIVLKELVVRPGSALAGRSAAEMRLRTRYGVNLLAVSREGARWRARLRTLRLQPGDLLLMQGPLEALAEFAADTGCVPLAERPLRLPDPRQALLAGGIMAAAVASAALGLLPAAIAFALGAVASLLVRTVPVRAVYQAVDWPVIVLLAALIPVAGAMESTGAADVIARGLLTGLARGEPVLALAVLLIVTMFLSDLMNNAATAVVMCPIAIGTAGALGVSADSFLMAVAIGASCAFLTPIGHQNNTLILGPGGFRFGDYWRLGLPLEVLVVAVALPLLLIIWPL